MKLNDFLNSEEISMGAFAKTVGTTTATISRVSDGIVVPRKALLERIYEATAGLVTTNDIVGIAMENQCTRCSMSNDHRLETNEVEP